jgi:hypothetical protein
MPESRIDKKRVADMAGAVTLDDRIWPRRVVESLLSLTLVVATAVVFGRRIDVPWLASAS